MYIFEDDDKEIVDIKQRLKDIVKNLGYTYIEKTDIVYNSNGIHKGTVTIGNVVITITYNTVVIDISVSVKDDKLNCTNDVSNLNKFCTDTQTASMVIKSIQESNVMD